MLSYTKRAMKITDIFYGQHNNNIAGANPPRWNEIASPHQSPKPTSSIFGTSNIIYADLHVVSLRFAPNILDNNKNLKPFN